MHCKNIYFIVFLGFFFFLTQAEAQNLPDLEMDSLQLPSQSRGYGSKIQIAFHVKNTGTVNAGSFFVNFYYSDAGTGTKRIYLGQKWVTGLVAKKTTPKHTLTLTLPHNCLYGRRSIIYFIDSDRLVPESDENNNFGSKSFQVIGKPNLQVLYLGAAPQSQVRSGILQVSYRVYNAGYSRVPKEFITRFYFSIDSTITRSDTDLKHQVKIKSLKAQEFIPGSFQAIVPANSPLGTAYLGAITDLNNSISENNESDNTQSLPLNIFLVRPAPDLLAVQVTISPKTQQEGKTIQITYNIKNQGNQVSKGFQLGFYFSKNPSITRSKTKLHTLSFSTLMVGQKKTGTISTRLPSRLSVGTGYIGIFVDHLNVIRESDESNNTKSTPIVILVDRDRDGHTNDKDCNDNDKTIYPGAKELCDGKDNDCDGKTDEGCPCKAGQTRICYPGAPSTIGIGPCKAGKQTCFHGNWGACVGARLPKVEKCDGIDNNCNAQVDESLFQGCYTGPSKTLNQGTCRGGFQACISGKWESCKGQSTPQPEGCDGKDNDCDGLIDNGIRRFCYSAPRDTIGKGICKQGFQLCTKGAWSTCQGEVAPTVEVCDGKDNDCDGQIDNQTSSPKSLKRDCSTACGKGEESCKKGKWLGCTAAACTEPTEGGSKEGSSKEGSSKEGSSKEGGSKEGGSKEGGSKEGGSKENPNPDNLEGLTGEENHRDNGDGGVNDKSSPDNSSEKFQDKDPKEKQNEFSLEPKNDGRAVDKGETVKDRKPTEIDYENINIEQGNESDIYSDQFAEFPNLRATGGCGCDVQHQPNRTLLALLFSCIFILIPLYRRFHKKRKI